MSEREEAGAGRQVSLQKIYLRDASVEVPDGPQVFTREWRPQIDVDLDTRVRGAGDEHHHVAVTVTVTARIEEQIAYIVEVQQAGVFRLRGFDDAEERHRLLGVYCPDTLFPYVREAVSELVQRAGFPPFLLQPINFDALYRRRLEERLEERNKGESAATPH